MQTITVLVLPRFRRVMIILTSPLTINIDSFVTVVGSLLQICVGHFPLSGVCLKYATFWSCPCYRYGVI
jgi:hypothetical protein